MIKYQLLKYWCLGRMTDGTQIVVIREAEAAAEGKPNLIKKMFRIKNNSIVIMSDENKAKF